jgi:hypothetical protein
MTTYESDVKTISSSEEVVFNVVSDLNNLQKIVDNPGMNDKLKDLQFDADSCSFTVDPVGKVSFRIIEREPFKTIKLKAENSPVDVIAWIQLKQVAENDTRLKLTLKAEIPTMIKMMVDKKLKEGINVIADMLAKALNTAL